MPKLYKAPIFLLGSIPPSLTFVHALLVLIEKHGKNWTKILGILHNEQHRVVDIKDPDKVRTRFNTINGKSSANCSKPKNFLSLLREERSHLTKAEIHQKQVLHGALQEKLRKEHEHAQQLLRIINEREKLLASSKENVDETKIRQYMLEKSEERRKVQKERMQKYNDDAEEEREYRKSLKRSLDNINTFLEKTTEMEDRFLSLMEKGLEIFQMKLQENQPPMKKSKKKSILCLKHILSLLLS